MKYIKQYGFFLIKTILYIIVSLLIVTLFYYNNLISDNTYKFIKLLILLFSVFINSTIFGKQTSNNKETINVSLLLIILLIILSLILNKFRINNILFYLIILSTSILGNKYGKRKKKKD